MTGLRFTTFLRIFAALCMSAFFCATSSAKESAKLPGLAFAGAEIGDALRERFDAEDIRLTDIIRFQGLLNSGLTDALTGSRSFEAVYCGPLKVIFNGEGFDFVGDERAKLARCKYLANVVVYNFEEHFDASVGNANKSMFYMEAAVNVYNIETGKLAAAMRIELPQFGLWENYSAPEGGDVIADMAVKMAGDISRYLKKSVWGMKDEVRVTKSSNLNVSINRGHADGVRAGDTFDIIEYAGVRRDGVSGEIIHIAEEYLGSIQIFKTGDRNAEGKILKALGAITEGAFARRSASGAPELDMAKKVGNFKNTKDLRMMVVGSVARLKKAEADLAAARKKMREGERIGAQQDYYLGVGANKKLVSLKEARRKGEALYNAGKIEASQAENTKSEIMELYRNCVLRCDPMLIEMSNGRSGSGVFLKRDMRSYYFLIGGKVQILKAEQLSYRTINEASLFD